MIASYLEVFLCFSLLTIFHSIHKRSRTSLSNLQHPHAYNNCLLFLVNVHPRSTLRMTSQLTCTNALGACIVKQTMDPTKEVVVCTGSLLDSTHVLTSAHCTSSKENPNLWNGMVFYPGSSGGSTNIPGRFLTAAFMFLYPMNIRLLVLHFTPALMHIYARWQALHDTTVCLHACYCIKQIKADKRQSLY